MLSVGDSIEAWIEEKYTGDLLNEYDVTPTPRTGREPSCTTCFLETTEKPFVIRLSKKNYIYDDIRAVCEVDGRDIGFQIWRANEYDYQWEEVWDRRNGKLYQSSLKFKTFPTTNDPAQVNVHTDDLEKFGKIIITLTLGTTKLIKKSDEIETFSPVEGKAMGNNGFLKTVTTTDTVKSEEWQPPCYTFKAKTKIPYHRFVFHYHSRSVLRFLGKIDDDDNDNSESGFRRFTPVKEERLSVTPSPQDQGDSDAKQVEEEVEGDSTSSEESDGSKEYLPKAKRRKLRLSCVKKEKK